jgi:hypothetical protein
MSHAPHAFGDIMMRADAFQHCQSVLPSLS